MAFKTGDMVRIKEIRDRHDYPAQMRLLSGQCGHVMGVIKTEVVGSGQTKTVRHYYELDTDAGYGLWPEDFLEPYEMPNTENSKIPCSNTVRKRTPTAELEELLREFLA